LPNGLPTGLKRPATPIAAQRVRALYSHHENHHSIADALAAVRRRSVCVAVLAACAHTDSADNAATHDAVTQALRSKVDTIVVIYAENRAFDNLYGNFPGAHRPRRGGRRQRPALAAYIPQIDRDGSVLPVLPPTWAA